MNLFKHNRNSDGYDLYLESEAWRERQIQNYPPQPNIRNGDGTHKAWGLIILAAVPLGILAGLWLLDVL